MIPIIQIIENEALLWEKFEKRSQLEMPEVKQKVQQIVADVRKEGDTALCAFTLAFDGACITPDNLRVTQAEIDAAYQQVDAQLLGVIRRAASNIRAFHEKNILKSWVDEQDGKTLGQVVRPIENVGVYVPGGTAAYPSSVLMNILPAKVAGVNKIVVTTPPNKQGGIDANILVCANEAGADEIYKVGGAQAIAALAFGTQTIPRVDKIVGPGNIYVANAKREVFGFVGIDMIAGPSEVLIVADETANPRYVAADMLAQAEHDPMAAAILLTDSLRIAQEVNAELEEQAKLLSRKEIAYQSMQNYGIIVVTKNLDEALTIANRIAPEHLELMVQNPSQWLEKVRHAGAIFLGAYSPEPLGDYYAGPNHVLPTSGTARFFSPLNTDDFMKKSSLISYSKTALKSCQADVAMFAKAEGLTAHARSVEIRFEEDV